MNAAYQLHLEKFLKIPDLDSKLEQAIGVIQDTQFTISDAAITHRWITHWDKEGLLLINKEKGRWRTFDLSEFIWLRMVVQLRGLGVGIPQIRMVKSFLADTIEWSEFGRDENVKEVVRAQLSGSGIDNVSDELIHDALNEIADHPIYQIRNWMDLLVLDMLLTEDPFAFIVIPDEGVIPYRWSMASLIEEKGIQNFSFGKRSFVSISTYEILNDAISLQPGTIRLLNPSLFSAEEWAVLMTLHEGNPVKIHLTMKDGGVKFIEVEEDVKVDEAKRLADLFRSDGYQEFRATSQKGDIVHGRITTKIKLK